MIDKSIEQIIEEAAERFSNSLAGIGDDDKIPFIAGALWAKDNLGMIQREDVEKLIEAMDYYVRTPVFIDGKLNFTIGSVAEQAIAEFESKYPKEK